MLLGLEVKSLHRYLPVIEASSQPPEVRDYLRHLLFGFTQGPRSPQYLYPMIMAEMLADKDCTERVRIARLLGYSGRETQLTDEARLKWIQYETMNPRY